MTAATVLDDPAAVARVDRSGMAAHLRSLPTQFRAGWLASESDAFPPTRGRVIVCAVGGSAIAADFLSACLPGRLWIPRDTSLPRGAGRGDLCLAVSYSGNTVEVLRGAQEAFRRGLPIVAVTSGGRLARLARRARWPLVALPAGLPPRAAFGYLMGGSAHVLGESLGVGLRRDIDAAARATAALLLRVNIQVPLRRNPAKQMATALERRTPIIVASARWRAVAHRWQTQLNENAKVLAWHADLPEANHNEIQAWASDRRASRFVAVILRDADEDAVLRKHFAALADVLRRKGAAVEVRPGRAPPLARMVHAAYLGDWTSFYLAVARGVDPTPLPAIAKTKSRFQRG